MAVYERSYRPFVGPRTPTAGRWRVVARYALAEAAAASGEAAAADALLERLREDDPTGPWGDRRDRSPALSGR